MSDDQIDVKISTDETSVVAGMRRAVEAVRGGSEGMKGAMEALGGAFEAVMAPLAAFMAVLKGGEFLKESVDETINFYKESMKLGRQLGITATEAGVLRTALGDVYSSTEDYGQAAMMLTRQVKQNEDAIKKMGIQTRDSNGNFRNTNDLMLDSIKVLNGYKEGTDRNMAAQTLFGRGASNLGGILKLNNEVIEEAKKKQEALGLTITQEGVEAVKKYRAAMNDAGDVMEGVSQTVGTAMLPILTKLANWFADIGPAVVAVFKGAMDVLTEVLNALIDVVGFLWDAVSDVFSQIASLASDLIGGQATTGMLTWDNAMKVVKLTLLALKAVIELVIDVIRGFVTITISYLQTWKNTVTALLQLDFSGAIAAWNSGMAAIENRVHQSAMRIKSDMAAIANQAVGVLNGKPGAGGTPVTSHGGGEGFAGVKDAIDKSKKGDKGDKTRTAAWANELDQQKLAHERMNQENGTFYQFSKEREAQYWQQILARHDLSSKERVEVERKFLDVSLAIRKEAFDSHIEGLKAELDAFKNNMNERLRVANQIADEMKQRFGAESKEYKQAAAAVAQIQRDKANQIKAVNEEIAQSNFDTAMSAVDAQEQQAQAELNVGLISQKELLQRQMVFENERYQIQYKALQDKLQLMENDPDMNPVEYQRLKSQILQVERQHQQQMRNLQVQALTESKKVQLQASQSLSQSWGSTLAQMMTGQMSFAQGVKALWQGLVGAITQALTQMIAQWIARKLAALILDKAMSGTSAASQIVANAGVAGSAAFASTAAIPIVGPALAPGAAAAAVAGAMSFLPMAFAEKGFDVPAGVNPITQLHQKEMVLPAEQADVIRGLAKGDTPTGGDTFHIHTMDASGVREFLMKNHRAVGDAVRHHVRNGGRVGA